MKQSTRSLSLLLVLALLCSLFVLPAAAEENSGIAITDAAGNTVTISDSAIKAAASETVAAEDPWSNAKGTQYYGTFYSLKSILETAGIQVDDAHGLKSVASDGFTNGFTTDELDSIYVYDMGEVYNPGSETPVGDAGTYGTAINGGAGNKWAKDIVSITVVTDHVWFFKGGSCKHYCSICGADEPSLTVTAADGTESTVYDCMIKAADSVEVTAEDPWGYGSNSFTGTFYSVKSILENAGIDVSDAHGLKSVASDGFTNGFSTEDLEGLYVYDMGAVLKNGEPAGTAGTYGTAINASAGNKWAKDIVSIAVATDHVWFVKGGACKHYCSICGADEEVVTDEAVPATDTHSGLTEGSHYASCGEAVVPQEKTPALVNPYTDVTDPNAYYYDPVLWAGDAGITNGYTATTFAPAIVCNRGQIVTFLWRMAGEPDPTITTCKFTDVSEDAFYYKAVLWAVEQGITEGTTDTTFSPSKVCNRGQIVTFLWRAAGKPAPTSECSFEDVASGSYCYDAVAWAVENKITNGFTETTFVPGKDCTRGQAVTFLYRAADLLFKAAAE